MAGRVYEDRIDAEHEEDGTLAISVEQPVNELAGPFVFIEGNVALSLTEARELVRRVSLAILRGEQHVAKRERRWAA